MMRAISLLTCSIVALVTVGVGLPWAAGQSQPVREVSEYDQDKLKGVDAIVSRVLAQPNTCPGAVVFVTRRSWTGDLIYLTSGQRAIEPQVEAMTRDTIFDMASITKPVATGTAIHMLVDQGKLAPNDPVAKYWPEFAANGKEAVTVKQCLLHTSGLTADNSIKDYANGRAEALKAIANLKLEAEPGTRFRYSDVGYIVLGELVERISGEPLDRFCHNHIFKPLGMKDTMFNPPEALHGRVAPTGKREGKIIRGTVHDPRAFALGGVAGHAGLFSTADDLTIYSRMLLNGGKLGDTRILSEHGVERFTKPRDVPPKGLRSLGWDVSTGFTAQRGTLFPEGEGFGHTGFTGTSIWIDPPTQTAIIILTNRVHPHDKGNVTALRREIGTLVASASPGIQVRAAKNPPPPAASDVKTGADLLAEQKFESLRGKRVGLVTNHTGRTSDGQSLIDLLAKADGVKLVALFSPEHGIRGEKDEKVGDGTDEKTGLPVFSLYGERRKPDAKTLEGIDTLVYDIQDIGCRFYTYISTLGLIMEAAKEHGLSVVVLDRPNPIGGVLVEGPMLDDGVSNFVGYHHLPLRHGMTVGELATMFNTERELNIPLTVVKCEGWRRGMLWDATGLPWRNPSPNMRHLTAALVYPGVGIVETTNVSVGRGTERPFEWIGAPWIDGRKLAKRLNAMGVAGVRFVPTERTPISSVHKDKLCGGVDIIVTDWQAVRPLTLGLAIITALRDEYPNNWETKRLNTLLLHQATLKMIQAGKTAAEIEATWAAALGEFQARRTGFLLYDN